MTKDDAPKGAADFKKAFNKAFDLLDKTFKATPALAQRPTTILFLSDTDAASPVEDITKRRAVTFAKDLNKLLIFTYSLGDSVTANAKKTLRS